MDVEPWADQRGKILKSNLIFEIFHMYKTCTKPVQCLYNTCTNYIKNVVLIIFTADWIFWTNK
jgi:hypothetical protein